MKFLNKLIYNFYYDILIEITIMTYHVKKL